MWSKFWHLWMFLLRSTTLECKMPNFSSVTHQICLYGSECDLGIHDVWYIWPCLIFKVFATSAKFFQLFPYCDQLHIHLSQNNIFGCIHGVLNLWNINSWIRLHFVFICVAFKSQMKWSNTQYVGASTTNRSEYLLWLKLLQSCDIRAANKHNFWLVLVTSAFAGKALTENSLMDSRCNNQEYIV